MCLAIPGQITQIMDAENHIAKVEVSGVRRSVNISLVADTAQVGDWVLIHVGFALSRIDEQAARQTLRFLETLGNEFEDEREQFGQSQIG